MGTRHRGTNEEINALNAFIKLARSAESVTVRIQTALPAEAAADAFDAIGHDGFTVAGAAQNDAAFDFA